MGNICRSPTAHGVMRTLLATEGLAPQVRVDSAGTHSYHLGHAPDARAQAAAQARGIDISDLRSRLMTEADCAQHDLILVMDWDNLALAQAMCPEAHAHKIRRLTEFCLSRQDTVVPDPYYGGPQGFDDVLDLVQDACQGLLRWVQQRLAA
jgi:protein-tyrosine phosphatase